jgi:hypothetical protein
VRIEKPEDAGKRSAQRAGDHHREWQAPQNHQARSDRQRGHNNCSGTPDLRAVKIVFDLLRDIESQTEPASTETPFTAADEEIIKQLKARLLHNKGELDE